MQVGEWKQDVGASRWCWGLRIIGLCLFKDHHGTSSSLHGACLCSPSHLPGPCGEDERNLYGCEDERCCRCSTQESGSPQRRC